MLDKISEEKGRKLMEIVEEVGDEIEKERKGKPPEPLTQKFSFDPVFENKWKIEELKETIEELKGPLLERIEKIEKELKNLKKENKDLRRENEELKKKANKKS